MNYLVLISRADFANFYKSGHIYLSNLVPYDGTLHDHSNDKGLFDVVTKYINNFEYDTEYLMLNLCKEVSTDVIVEVTMGDVKDLYALSNQAKISLEASFDPRINIQVSEWEPFFIELGIEQAIRQAKIGVSNCYKIFGISKEEITKINSILPSNLIAEVYNDVYNRVRPSRESSLWNYLIRYERHCPYWNDKRGFFSDAIHIYENKRMGEEIEYEIVEEKPIGSVLENCDPKLFDHILQNLEEFSPNDYMMKNCRYLVIAPIYLYLKSEFKDGGITSYKFAQLRNTISYLHNSYGSDFAVSIALLGLTLGQDLTYEYFYEVENLNIFSSNENFKKDSIKDSSSDIIEEISPLVTSLQSLLDSRDEEIITLNNKIQELENQLRQSLLTKEIGNSRTEEEQTKLVEYSKEEKQILNKTGDENSPSCNYTASSSTPTHSEEKLACEIESTSFDFDIQKEIPSKLYPEDSVQSEVYCVEETQGVYDSQRTEIKEVLEKEQLNLVFEPVQMRRLDSRKTRFLKNSNPIWAHNKEEFDKLINERYAPLDYFDNCSIFPNKTLQ